MPLGDLMYIRLKQDVQEVHGVQDVHQVLMFIGL